MLPFEEVLRGERKKTKRKLKVQLDDIEEKQNLDNGSEEKSKGNRWLQAQGFEVPQQIRYARQRLLMPQENVSENAAKCEQILENNGLKVTQYSEPRRIELTNLEL